VLDCGRRFGKDIMERNYISEGLMAGEPCAWFEPNYKSLMDNWRWFTETYFHAIKRRSEVEKRIDLINGGFVEMWSLEDKDASRGRRYKRVAVNEAAKVPHLEYSWNNVIRITLADLNGGAVIGSTPRGFNFFKQLYDRGMDPLEPEWAAWKKPTSANPYIPPAEIEEMRRTLPDIVFQQEIMAEFISDAGMVFRRVQEAATLQPLDGPLHGRQYLAGVDVASSIDFTVVSTLDAQSREQVFIDRFNRVDYTALEDRLEAAYRRWNMTGMVVEVNSIGQVVVDHLAGRGMNIIPFTTTSATKQTVIQALQSAFEHGLIRILDDAVQTGELLSFESKRNPSGSFAYSAPEGMHDDTVMALALAWSGMDAPSWGDVSDLGKVSGYRSRWE
jgi:phage terminase large subunit-like protein